MGRASTHEPIRLFAAPRSFGPSTVCVCPGGANVATGYQIVIFHFPPIFFASTRNGHAPSLADAARRPG